MSPIEAGAPDMAVYSAMSRMCTWRAARSALPDQTGRRLMRASTRWTRPAPCGSVRAARRRRACAGSVDGAVAETELLERCRLLVEGEAMFTFDYYPALDELHYCRRDGSRLCSA